MHTRFFMDQFTVFQVCLLQLRNQKETLVVNLKLGSDCKSVFSNCESSGVATSQLHEKHSGCLSSIYCCNVSGYTSELAKSELCLPLLARSKPHITPTFNQNSNSVCYSPHREQLLDKSYFMEQFKVSQKCLFTDEKLQGTCCGTNLKLGLLGKSIFFHLWKLGSCRFIADSRTSGGLIPIHCSMVCG